MVDGLAIHNSLSYRMVYLYIQVTDLSQKIHTRKLTLKCYSRVV